VLSGTAVALLAGNHALAAGGRSGDRDRRADPQHRPRSRAGGDRRVSAWCREQAAAKARARTWRWFSRVHHKEHADLLAKTVEKLGGKPVAAKAKYDFPVAQLKAQADVLASPPSSSKARSAPTSARCRCSAIAIWPRPRPASSGDEAMHWAILRQVLGETPVPAAFVA
jgi:hypothetical protein